MPQSKTKTAAPGRIVLMDELRGFAVFCMVFYHGFYTTGYLFGNDVGRYYFLFFMPAEPFFAGLFIFISGIASNLTHSNLARGLKLLLLALGVTLITGVFLPDDIITFGILHFLAICMIAVGLVKPSLDRYRFSWLPVLACALLFFFTKNIPAGMFGPSVSFGFPLPDTLYRIKWLAPLGFPGPGFQSADYFPLLPWSFVFVAGLFVGKLAATGKFPAFTYKSQVPLLSWFGRHALIIYLAHQLVIYGVCLLLYRAFGSLNGF